MARKSILVVDDAEDSRELTEAALLSAGYNDVVTAGSAWEAMKILDIGRLNETRPSVDLVLLDIIMPEIDGIEACARIRSDPRYADFPIIMVTSLADMDSLANAFVAGGTNNWHTYGINWTSSRLEWFIDGIKVRTYTAATNNGYSGVRRTSGTKDAASGNRVNFPVEANTWASRRYPSWSVHCVIQSGR